MIRPAPIIAALAVIIATAGPVGADSARFETRHHGTLTVPGSDDGCATASPGITCAAYRSGVAVRLPVRRNDAIAATLREVGRQQLDALIASIK